MTSLLAFRRLQSSPIAGRALRWAIQLIIFVMSGLGAFLLRFDFTLPRSEWAHVAYAIPIWVIVKTVVFRILHLDNRSWRYISATELTNLVSLNALASLISVFVIRAYAPRGFP